MQYKISEKIIPEDLDPTTFDKQHVFGDDICSGHIIIRSDKNEQMLYLDGAGMGGAPQYIGITKSRGTQLHKLPIEPNDMIGGLQVYARIKEGKSLGYNQSETPLCGGIHFKVAPSYENSSVVPTEFLIALTDSKEGMSIKLKVDQWGNLVTAGNIQTGKLEITDQIVSATPDPVKFVKAVYNGREYAIPLHLIQ